MKIRRVVLELLRAGPPHNQLLSPLTQYLATCGEAGASVVNLPYEHHVFLRRLRELRYKDGTDEDTARRLEILYDTGQDVAQLLGSVCGLPGALIGDRGTDLTHLRLVLSASELAMLPFELSKIPPGVELPADNWLLLQCHAPVCLTRHVRSVPTTNSVWPSTPRILFIAGNTGDIPFEKHQKELEDAVAPWAEPDGNIDHILTVVGNATLEKVQEVFASEVYTHVHFLAHGAKDEALGDSSPYGVALVSEDGYGDDVVSGERLATALRAKGRLGAACRPTVVTLATCDSGNEKDSVEAPVASLAYALHAAGVPLVVASQFPLSFDGSVILARMLYQGVLWGEHPVHLLYHTRIALHGLFVKHSHDWASIVAYEALPSERVLEEQLEVFVYEQSKRALDAAREALDAVMPADGEGLPEPEALADALARIDRSIERLPRQGCYRVEALGLRASAEKLRSEVFFRVASNASGKVAKEHSARMITALEDALELYRDATLGFLVPVEETFHRKATLHWVLMQYLTLQGVLGRKLSEERLMTVKLVAEEYLDHAANEERVWAHGSLAEVWLLRLLLPGQSKVKRAASAEQALGHASSVLALYPRPDAFPLVSTRRQLARYIEWWGDARFVKALRERGIKRSPGWTGEHGVLETARRMVAILDRKEPRV